MRYSDRLQKELHALAVQNSKRHTHFLLFLRAIWGIDASNGWAVFLLFLHTVSALPNHPQIRYLIFFTDCRCCPSEILQNQHKQVLQVVWSLVPKSRRVSGSLSPRHSTLPGIWVENGVGTHFAMEQTQPTTEVLQLQQAFKD